MQHREFEPAQGLRDSIKCFWHNVRNAGEAGSDFEVQPDGYVEIIFYFGNLTNIAPGGEQRCLPSPFIMGLLNLPAMFCAKNRLDIIGIRCYPWTVFDLLGLPSGKSGVQTFEHPIALLQSQLSNRIENGNIQEALAVLTNYLLDARQHVAPNSMLFKAGIAMSRAKGTLPVSQVAEAAHATVRTLERKFKQSSGHTVKDVSGLMRFEQVRNHLWHNPNYNLASLAHQLGYADQAHLSKEFKRYSGTTPAAFAKKAKLMVNTDFVAFVQA